MPSEILSLSVTFAVCKLTVLINGFPVVQESSSSSSNQQYPVNQYLIEGSNQITLRIEPAPPIGIMDISGAQVQGGLKVFLEGQVVTPEDGEKLKLVPQEGDAIEAFEITEALDKHLDPTQTLEINYTFDCSIMDFSNRFLESPVIEDEDAVKAYAEKLRGILAEKNAPAFMEELAPKITDQAKAYYQDEAEFNKMFAESFATAYFEKPFHLEWERDDLELVPWCDSRFIEIKVNGNSILDNLRNPEDGWMNMPCFVSLVDGELKVTR